MRNPNRIEPLLEKLAEAWHKYPDQRFGQFLTNFLGACRHDVWHTEDDEWMAGLQAYIDGKDPDKAMQTYGNRKLDEMKRVE